jgi:hypothetical protein
MKVGAGILLAVPSQPVIQRSPAQTQDPGCGRLVAAGSLQRFADEAFFNLF